MIRQIGFSLTALIALTGCQREQPPVQLTANTSQESIVLVSVQSDAHENPQSVDMALKLAGFSVDEGRRVAMFFNVKGVTIPVKAFPDDIGFQDNAPIKKQLADLIGRGVDVHVCPICMKALGVDKADIMEGAKVTTRPSLFANIGPDTAVFTY
ncbi:hypothetical protein GC176_24505 [bacterium]|nr:hypothetical protein [bacterium]